MTRLTSRMRRPHQDDSGAALLISLLTILIATSLSVAVLGSVVSQLTPAQFGMKNTRTAHAAEAGLDTALGVIRTALSPSPQDNTTIVGDRRKLPCTAASSGSLSGTVAGSSGNLTYVVQITYFDEDPAGKDSAWRTANALACTANGPVQTPLYAVLSSTGSGTGTGPTGAAGIASRTLETVYNLSFTNRNVTGGLIHSYFDDNAATLDLCFDAGSATPPVGTSLLVQRCSPGSAQQMFSWRSDYSIVVSGTQGTPATERCVTAAATSGVRYATLEACTGSYKQKWGYTDSGGFVGQLDYNPPGSTAATRYCLDIVSDNTPGSRVAAATDRCLGYNRRSTWRPEARVGAGNAGTVSGPVQDVPMQWVNYAEFGRCYDVTNWTVGYAFMIAYPCKQEPTGYVGWNQTMVWAGTAAGGQLYTYAGPSNQTYAQTRTTGTRYCATAPVSAGGYVTMSVCAAGEPRQRWVVNRGTISYATSYTVTDSYGRCMSVGAPNMGSGVQLKQWSTIVSEACNASTRQKWNAPPRSEAPQLSNTAES